MLPALFIVPYIQLVFGVETIQRALRRYPFPQRLRYTIPVCLAIVVVGLIGTYVVTRFVLPPEFCFASLFWLVRRWALGCFVLTTTIASVLLIGSIITLVRLYRTAGISETERIAASWMACYMLLATITLAIMTPFFWSLHIDPSSDVQKYRAELGMASTVAANLSGLTSGGLYIALRSTRLGRFGPRGYFEFDRQRPLTGGKRSSTPGGATYTKQIELPVSPVRLAQVDGKPLAAGDRVDAVDIEEKRTESRPSTPTRQTAANAEDVLRNPFDALTPASSSSAVREPEPTAATPTATRPRRPSAAYSIFPSSRQEVPDVKSTYILPAAAYDPVTRSATGTAAAGSTAPTAMAAAGLDDVLLPPPGVRTSGHMRDLSAGSSAMVQIGLRVSNINDIPPVTSYYDAPYRGDSAYSGNYGLAITTDMSPVQRAPPPLPPLRTDMDATAGTPADEADKLLPPVPLSIAKKDTKGGAAAVTNPFTTDKQATAGTEEGDGEEITLSPSVYSPSESSSSPSPRSSPKGSSNSPRGMGTAAANRAKDKGKGRASSREQQQPPARPPPPPQRLPDWSPVEGARVKSVEWI
ncbi:hypothetical protein JDV02_005249 [Purpureocillium takamizusanense]|uniref:Uncharacterized protein n=1 Tax=Purpureocillium takamizusanense TaxID=2060973 RepID=A0A9Q8QG36_9HYPO|nr:uncharacterized protein JDV02_005249 [Purpureocillium takamizusanense]UNI19030.1 hypothetical protein JDV02_005249 [Purpureocillium takamizusanense]